VIHSSAIIYADAEAAFEELTDSYKVPLNRIVLYGQSIGTAPTVHLATRHKVAGVILHSPLNKWAQQNQNKSLRNPATSVRFSGQPESWVEQHFQPRPFQSIFQYN